MRARMLALSIVLLAVFAGASVANVTVAPPSINTAAYGPGETPVALLALFNSGPDNLQVTIGSAGAGSCAQFSFAPIDVATDGRATVFPIVLAPSELVQIRITVASTTSITCAAQLQTKDLATGMTTLQSVMITFNFSGSGSPSTNIDVQPVGLMFGQRIAADPIVQSIHVANLTGSGETETITTPPGVTFAGGGGCVAGMTSCLATLGSSGDAVDIPVVCDPSPSQTGGAIGVSDGNGNSEMIGVACQGQGSGASGIVEANTHVVGTAGVMATATVAVSSGDGSEQIDDAYFVGNGDNSIELNGCGAADYCTFGSGQPLAVGVPVACIPDGVSTQSSQLVIHGRNAQDSTVATITCDTGSGTSTPILDVDQNNLAFADQDVGTMSAPQEVTVSDDPLATAPLTNVHVSIGDVTDYELDCGSCTFSSIAVGSADTFHVTFVPQSAASLPTTLFVAADGVTTKMIPVSGTGDQGAIALDQPLGPVSFDIGKNQVGSATIQITNSGDISTDTQLVLVDTGGPAILSLSGSDIPLTAGHTGTANISCESATPGSETATVQLTTAGVTAGSNFTISVSCTVEDTNVSITPNSFQFGDAFGELRRDANQSPQVETFTLTNNGAAPATIGQVMPSRALTHVSIGAVSPTTIAPGGSASFDVTVDPDAGDGSGSGTDEDFKTMPLTLTVPVDTTHVSASVTGAVVFAQTSLDPGVGSGLDLGSLCVGETTSGQVVLTNTGTAHVGVPTAPTMTTFGITSYLGGPVLAPAPAGGSASTQVVTVAPTVAGTAPGALDGLLTWQTDVPDDYQLPVELVYVGSGGAISPATLAYASQMAGQQSAPQTVTVRNCDVAALPVSIGALTVHVGEARDWIISPAPGSSQMLQPGGTAIVMIIFSPHGNGHFYAELPVTAGSNTTVVQLTGDATGATQTETDFYACGCRGPDVPLHGWPVAVVIAGLTVGRRRGARSADRRRRASAPRHDT